ncbi:MAG: enoyl-CoA hydratase-related protein [Acidobacteriota bacterium]|nr:enoyl-CoA hydratase-related protein [Acidobacteriota bacterium]
MSRESRSEVLLERQDGDLLWVTLNDPRRANALSPALVAALTATFARDLRAEGVRAVLLTGAGKHFSAGADLANLRKIAAAGLEENRADSERLRGMFEALVRQEALTIALVHGACVAGGCGLATACDFVVAADDARFMYSEVRIGFVAALVATYLSLRLRGSDVREMLLNPEFLPAGPALEIGLVNRMVPEGELRTAGTQLAAEILSKASSESIARTKRILLDILGRPLNERFDLAAEANAQSRLTDDCRRGVAAFLEDKKSPDWRRER